MGDMMTLIKLRRGNYSLVEEKIPEGAKGVGLAIKDLGLSDQCVIAGIIRKGEVMIPVGLLFWKPVMKYWQLPILLVQMN